MDSEKKPPAFPESEVDKLITDFGRPPKAGTDEQIKRIINEQRPKYEALNRAVKTANEPEQKKQVSRKR